MYTGSHFMDVDDSSISRQPLDCPYCSEEFTTVEDLRVHKRAHHVNKNYECKLCNASFVSLLGWRYHYKGHNSDLQDSCDSCNLKFKSFQQYVLHLENHKYFCSSCEKSFAKKEHLRLHERKVHNILDGNYHTKIFDEFRCPKCNEEFRSHSWLRKHRKNNAQCSPFPCMKCGKGFLSQVHLDSHTAHFKNCRKVAEKREQRKFRNEQKKLTASLTPTISVPRVDSSSVPEEVKSYSCNGCSSKFPKKQLRREHWIRNKECRPYGCSHCNARFVNKTDLEVHLRCHLPKCLQCLKRFLNWSDFENHCCKSSKETTGSVKKKEKNFKCLYCCETYFNEGQLQEHIDLVIERYMCPECLVSFNNKCTFGYHMMIDHGIAKEDL